MRERQMPTSGIDSRIIPRWVNGVDGRNGEWGMSIHFPQIVAIGERIPHTSRWW